MTVISAVQKVAYKDVRIISENFAQMTLWSFWFLVQNLSTYLSIGINRGTGQVFLHCVCVFVLCPFLFSWGGRIQALNSEWKIRLSWFLKISCSFSTFLTSSVIRDISSLIQKPSTLIIKAFSQHRIDEKTKNDLGIDTLKGTWGQSNK